MGNKQSLTYSFWDDSEKACEVARNEVASLGDVTGDHLLKLLG